MFNFEFYKSGIARRLITYMIIFSGFITVLITGFQLLWDYKKDVGIINEQLEQITQVNLKTLSASLWAVDNQELKTHLEGILKIRDIQFLEITENNTALITLGTKQTENVISRKYPMFYSQRGQEVQIGTLFVVASLNGVYQRLIDKVWVILISNGIKTFLVATFMLILFYRLNTRHLIRIAHFTNELNTENLGEQLFLERKINSKTKQDELDLVVNSFNQMQLNIKDSFSALSRSELRSFKLTQELQQHKKNLEVIIKERTSSLITARNEAESASTAKSEFLSRMSHELRTPLNAILGFSQILQLDSDRMPEIQKGNIQEILDAGHHLLKLINEVLDLARIESGKLEISIEEVLIEDVIRLCLPLIKNQADSRYINIIDNISDKSFSIHADFTRLKQVLLNLLSNAVKYNKDKGSITIDGEIIDEKRLRICITDTGVGLPKSDIDKLFTSFERLNTTENIEGTGIGLVITKHLVELMNGTIGITSTPNKSTTFWVEFELFSSQS